MGAAAQATRRILTQSGALLEGDHFVYISGEHGSGWIDKDAVYPRTDRTSELGALLARACAGRGVEVVCGPATGGLIVAQWTAHHLGALAVFGEHPDRRSAADGAARRPFVLGRGYERLVAGRRVLVVDDVLNTGFSLRGTVEAVRSHGGVVTEAGVVVNRGAAGAADLEVDELVSLLDHRLDSWPAAGCPLCRDGVPVNTEYAHGRDFVRAGGRWP